jgi:hypothetical protein
MRIGSVTATKSALAWRGALLSTALLGSAVGCDNSHTPTPTDAGQETSAPQHDAAVDTGASCGMGCYRPKGCLYEVAPPENAVRAMGYTGFSVDTGTPLHPSPGVTPQRVRLGLGGGTAARQPGYADPTTTAVFTWETAEADSHAEVKMGTSPAALGEIQTGYSFSYASLGPAVHIHEVHVCGLTPGRTYYYQVGGGVAGAEVWSATQSFTTVPATGPVSIGIYGDARDSVSVWQTVNLRMKQHAVSMDLISGDIVLLGVAETEWGQWLDAIWTMPSEQEAGVPGLPGFLTLGQQLMVPIAGNHEAESSDFYANFSIPGTGDYAKTYASFNVGSAHIVMFDDTPLTGSASADSLSPEPAAQIAWLRSDLALADKDRDMHPFVLVMNHRGLYSTSEHGNDPDVLLARSVLAPIFDTYHVDLVLNGRNHEYERSYPVRANAADAASNEAIVDKDASSGTIYVTNAGAGASAYATNSLTAPENYRAFSWQFDFDTGYVGCYGILELDGKSLTMTAYGVKGAASADDVIDKVVLSK